MYINLTSNSLPDMLSSLSAIVFPLLLLVNQLYMYKKCTAHVVFHCLIRTILLIPALLYLFSLLNSPLSSALFILNVLLLFLFIYRAVRFRNEEYSMAINGPQVIQTGVILTVLFLGIEFLFREHFLLPGHDPVLLPTFARLLYDNDRIVWTMEPLTSLVYLYPPGGSLLLMLLHYNFHPLHLLFFWKHVNLLIIILCPFIWTYYGLQIFGIRTKQMWQYCLLSMFAFFVFDRTLTFTPLLAGKNAMLLASFLFPAVFYDVVKPHRIVGRSFFSRSSFSVLLCLGLLLCHYATVYMLMLSVIAYFMARPDEFFSRKSLHAMLPICFAVVLLLPFAWKIRDASFQASSGSHADLMAIKYLLNVIVFKFDSPFFFIFSEMGIHWSGKNIIVISCFILTLMAIIAGGFSQRFSLFPAKHRLALLFSMYCIFFCIFLAAKLSPFQSINLDYVRWFSFNFVALFMFFFLLSLFHQVASLLVLRNFFIVVLIIISLFVLYFDIRDIHRINENSKRVSYGEVKDFYTTIQEQVEGGVNYWITMNMNRKSSYYWIQDDKRFEYLYFLTGDIILNGFWAVPARPGSTVYNGLPGKSFLHERTFRPLLFALTASTAENYEKNAKVQLQKMDWALGPYSIFVYQVNDQIENQDSGNALE